MARSGPQRTLKRTSHEGTRQEGGHLADRGEGKGKRRSGMHANGPSKWRLLSRPGERVVQGALEMGWREAMRSPFELGGGGGHGRWYHKPPAAIPTTRRMASSPSQTFIFSFIAQY